MRIMLRKATVRLKPHYEPLVKVAKAAYSSGFGKRSGALAGSFGMKVWSAKRGDPRSAVIIGVNNKAGLKKFRSWQSRARSKYLKTLDGKLVHPLPKRLTDPGFHKPSKILHLVDKPVKSHRIKPVFRKVLAAPEKGVNAMWPISKAAGGTSGKGVIARIRKKGAAIAKRRHGEYFHQAFGEELDKKMRSAFRKSSRGQAI